MLVFVILCRECNKNISYYYCLSSKDAQGIHDTYAYPKPLFTYFKHRPKPCIIISTIFIFFFLKEPILYRTRVHARAGVQRRAPVLSTHAYTEESENVNGLRVASGHLTFKSRHFVLYVPLLYYMFHFSNL